MRWINNFPTPRIPKYMDDFLNRNPWKSEIREDEIALPAMNVAEGENDFEMEIIAPGRSKKDFGINVNDGILTIRTEHKTESESKKDGYTYQEYSYAGFVRSFRIPDSLDEESIKATYRDGILRIHFSKKENTSAKKPKMITVS